MPEELGFDAPPTWWPLPLLATLPIGAGGLAVMPLVIVAVVVAYVTTAHLTPAGHPIRMRRAPHSGGTVVA